MRVKAILGVTLSALLLTSTVTRAVALQPTSQLAASVTAPAQSQTADNGSAAARQLVWYTDPIVFALVVFAVFAAVHIAILITKTVTAVAGTRCASAPLQRA